MSGGGNVLLFSNISFIYLILFLQLGVVIYNKVVLDSHKNVECPVDKNLTVVNNVTLGIILTFIAIVIFSHLSNKKLKNLKK